MEAGLSSSLPPLGTSDNIMGALAHPAQPAVSLSNPRMVRWPACLRPPVARATHAALAAS